MLIDKLNWSLLYTYLIIAEEKSISLAALRLNLTQSAVSQSLKRLEDQLGVKLIERSNQVFYLTEQGKTLYETAQSIYKKLLNLEFTLDETKEELSGTLELMLINGIRSDEFDTLLANFHQENPHIQINIKALPNKEIMKRLVNNFPSIAIAIYTKNIKSLNSVFYLPQRYSLYCGHHHPLFKKEKITEDDVLTENFVIYDSEQMGEALSPLAIFRHSTDFKGHVVSRTNNLTEQRRLIIAGFGIGALPDRAAQNDVRLGRLRRLPPEEGVADIPLHIIWNKERVLKPAEKAFIKSIAKHQKELGIDSDTEQLLKAAGKEE